MAGGYNVLPLAPDQLEWLQSQGIHVAEMLQPSRFPSLNEFRQVVSMIAGFRAEFDAPDADKPWRVVIDSEENPGGEMRSSIRITPFEGDDAPHGIWFEQGWPPMVVAIAQQLAAFTGPLVILATADGTPALVEAGSDVATLLRSWKHTASRYG